VYPIVKTFVVELDIGGIKSHVEYDVLRAANPTSEFRLLQKMQETCNWGNKALNDKFGLIFFKDNN
jgi:hypothetical protein